MATKTYLEVIYDLAMRAKDVRTMGLLVSQYAKVYNRIKPMIEV